MMPFGIGWPELTIVLVIVLVLFGASRVPEVGGAIGKGIKEFRRAVTRDDGDDKDKDGADSKAEAGTTSDKS